MKPNAQKQYGRRYAQLFVGLSTFGVGNALMLRSDLGMDPWNVFHQGIATHVPLTLGTIIVVVSLAVMLFWIPLQQKPGVGTIANAIWLGISTDIAIYSVDAILEATPHSDGLAVRVIMAVVGIVVIGWSIAAYIGAHLGPGPRDGLMTGLNRLTGKSIRFVRTALEIAVLILGVILGGTFGVGTILFAVAVGPLVQFFLPRLEVNLTGSGRGLE